MALVLVFTAGAVAAQTYSPSSGELAASDDRVTPGQSVTVSGAGFKPGSTVSITFDGAPVGTATAGDDGRFSRAITIPANAAAGQHTVQATGRAPDDGTRVLGVVLTVEGAGQGVPTPQGTLPKTGETMSLRLQGGAAAAVLSLLAAVVALRRKEQRYI